MQSKERADALDFYGKRDSRNAMHQIYELSKTYQAQHKEN